jgi:sugar lactone lactonase YvrE/imidazoleglycerol phosphate dehydratase HisB
MISFNGDGVSRPKIVSFKKSEFILVIILLLGIISVSQAGMLTGHADIVLGQADFLHGAINNLKGTMLDTPYSVAVDSNSGRVYVSDQNNNRVLWWNNSSSLTNGQAADGVLGQPDFASNASACTQTGMNGPMGICVDGLGNVWVADEKNRRVLKFNTPILAAGAAADIVLGQANFTSSVRACTQTGMKEVYDVSVDRSGNVWVADAGNGRVLKFNSPVSATGEAAAIVLGQANFTTAVSACSQTGMASPVAASVDGSGNVWVADSYNNRVLKFNIPALATGEAADLVLGQANFTSSDYGSGLTGLSVPEAVSVDTSGNVWISDKSNYRVLKFNIPASETGETADMVLGQTDFTIKESGCSQTKMNVPQGVFVDVSGNVWIADPSNNRVLKFNTPALATGEAADLVLGHTDFTQSINVNASGIAGSFDVATDPNSGRVYVSDTGNSRILWWNDPASLTNGKAADGVVGQTDFKSYDVATTQTGLNTPQKICVDGSGNLWVADYGNNRILKFNTPSLATGEAADMVLGPASFTAATQGCSQSEMKNPYGVTVDNAGNVWVADTGNNRVLKFNAPASATGETADIVLGQPNYTSGTSNCSKTGFNSPMAISADSAGNAWVDDTGNCRILKFNTPVSATGETADIVLGQPDFTSGNADCTQTGLGAPYGVNVDNAGNVWVADSGYNRILKFNTPTAATGKAADSVFCQPNFTTSDPGCTAEKINNPVGLCIDRTGNMWVVDGNCRVLEFKALSLASITPGSALNTGSVNVSNLAGSDFLTGDVVMLAKTGQNSIQAANVSVLNSGKITCAFNLTGKATGYWDVVVSTGGTGSLSAKLVNGFLIKTMTASSITPNRGDIAGPVNITDLAGQNFAVGAEVKLTKTGENSINASSVTVVSSSKIACLLDLRNKATGYWNVVVSTGGTGSLSSTLSNGFLITVVTVTTVTVSSITPVTGKNNGSLNTDLAGRNFSSGAVVKLTKTGENSITASSVTVVNPNKIICAFDLTNRATGYWTVVVSTGAAGSQSSTLSNGFLITAVNATIIYVSSITPDTASNAGPIKISDLEGKNFSAGAEVKLTKEGQNAIIASSVTVVNSNKISCVLDLSGKATGYWDVVVSTGGAGSLSCTLAHGFSITASTVTVPTIINIATGQVNPLTSAQILICPASGDIKIDILAGTFNQLLNITVSTSTIPVSNKTTIKVSTICLEITNNLSLQPDKLVNITVNYRHSDITGLDEAKLVLCRYDPAHDLWIKLPTTVDTINNIITATTNHLSKFVVVQLVAATDLNSAYVYPSPYKPSIHANGITFAYLTANTRIKIFNITGELINEISDSDGDGVITWYGKNKDNNMVASGVYIAYIEGSKSNKTVKFAIIK